MILILYFSYIFFINLIFFFYLRKNLTNAKLTLVKKSYRGVRSKWVKQEDENEIK
jgi:hypothetical protein